MPIKNIIYIYIIYIYSSILCGNPINTLCSTALAKHIPKEGDHGFFIYHSSMNVFNLPIRVLLNGNCSVRLGYFPIWSPRPSRASNRKINNLPMCNMNFIEVSPHNQMYLNTNWAAYFMKDVLSAILMENCYYESTLSANLIP